MHFLKQKPELTLQSPPLYLKEHEALIKSCFESHKAQHPHAFDAKLIFIEKMEGCHLRVFWGCYALLIAQRFHPHLFDFYSLAITGIGREGEDFIMGRRSQKVLQYPGAYDWVPAGGVDYLHPKIRELQPCFYKELKEECNLESGDLLQPPQIEGLLVDEKEKIVDVIFSYSLDPQKIKGKIKKNDEHNELIFLSENQLKAFIKNPLKTITPSAAFLFKELQAIALLEK